MFEHYKIFSGLPRVGLDALEHDADKNVSVKQ